MGAEEARVGEAPDSVPEVPLTLSESPHISQTASSGRKLWLRYPSVPFTSPDCLLPDSEEGLRKPGRVELSNPSLFRKSPLWPVGVWLSSVCVVLAFAESSDEAQGTFGQRKIDVGDSWNPGEAATHTLLITTLFLSLFLQSWPQ